MLHYREVRVRGGWWSGEGHVVKLRANRQKTKDKLGPEIGSVMA